MMILNKSGKDSKLPIIPNPLQTYTKIYCVHQIYFKEFAGYEQYK